MSAVHFFITFFSCFLVVSASYINEVQPRAECTVTSYLEVAAAVANCDTITFGSIFVPAGVTLELNLLDDATVVFEGNITFGYEEWEGHLVHIKGKHITVIGEIGHVFDGQGARYWDGLGGNGGKKKPKFFSIQATGGSILKGIHLLNCAKHCVSISQSDNLILSNWNIDSSAGDINALGHNTDGFDISSSTNVIIENSQVKNQDDCVAVNGGSNMKFTGLTCSGGHGLSLSVGLSKTNPEDNVVSNIVFSDCTVTKSLNGIHVKTHSDGTTGSITYVIYSNIQLSDITNYAINIQEDYENGSGTGSPKGNVPITQLILSNIIGTMSGSNSVPVYVLCGTGGCSDWDWSGISITGNEKASSCNYHPAGYTC